MNVIPLTRVRYRMGAEELIELGRSGNTLALSRTPFLANRPRAQLGSARLGDILDIVKDVGGIITGALGFALTTLGDLVSIPLDILSQGIDLVFTNVAGLLDQVPIVGTLLSQILLLGNAVIKFALSIPGLLLHGLGNIMTGISKALLAKNTTAQNQANTDKAKNDIISKAPPNLQSGVAQVLNASGMTAQNMIPSLQPAPAPAAGAGGPDLASVLAVGLPVVGVGAAVLLLAR
jgi:hypothetical protein